MSILITVLAVLALVVYFIRRKMKGKQYYGKRRADGMTIVVTGANSGIGKALTEELAGRGATVIMACRNKDKAETARRDIIQRGVSPASLVVELLDLSAFSSVLSFSRRLVNDYKKIDVLVNNAGIIRTSEDKTKDGIDSLLQANFLGHFLLVESIRHKIQVDRIVFVSSLAQKHAISMDLEEELPPVMRYCRAKLAEVSYARRLAGEGQLAYSCNPGVVFTNIFDDTVFSFASEYLSPLVSFFMKSPLQGAQTALMLCLEPSNELQSGSYYSDCSLDIINKLETEGRREKLMQQTREILASAVET